MQPFWIGHCGGLGHGVSERFRRGTQPLTPNHWVWAWAIANLAQTGMQLINQPEE